MTIQEIIGAVMLATPLVVGLTCAMKTEEGRAACTLLGIGTFVMLWIMLGALLFLGGF